MDVAVGHGAFIKRRPVAAVPRDQWSRLYTGWRHCSDIGMRSATVTHVRIIAGEFRGRQLLGPQGDATRPITDRAKQSLFDILTPIIPGANVYDLFSGTGSLGLESLSRGAKFASFFEIDRSAIARLSQNVAALQVS